MPRMTPACLDALICLMTPTSGVVAMVEDYPEPLAAIYPPGALESGSRRMREGKHTLRDWIVELESLGLMRRWNIPPALKPCFENVNHPGDWNAFAP
jgi:molybdopterin-guanine dinucleotide biosynthesis protein A